MRPKSLTPPRCSRSLATTRFLVTAHTRPPHQHPVVRSATTMDNLPDRIVARATSAGSRILATAAHFNSYYSNTNDRHQPHQSANKWKLPVIIVASILGAVLIAAAVFFLIKRSRRGASYRNIEKPNMGEHRDVFDARITEALETDAGQPLSRDQGDGDYAHPYGDAGNAGRRGSSYGDVDTAYRGPEKPYSEKAQDHGA